MMKTKLYKLTFAISLIVVLTTCSDDFLNVPIQGGVTTATDPALAQKLVTGVYHSLLQGDSWGNGDVHGFAFISVTSIMSDDADKGSSPTDQAVPVGDIDNFTLTPTNKFCESLWSGHYNSIGAANQALRALETAAVSEDFKNQLIGEVRFLRGYLYFNLVRMYGGVPLVLRVPNDATDANTDPAFQTRATVEAVYENIVQDLQFAVDNLQLKGARPPGHATKGAAQSLLAKVYMYKASAAGNPNAMADWQKVFDLTDAVITSGRYSLVDDYATIWRQVGDNNSESIFEIQTGSFNNGNLNPDLYTVCQGVRQGGVGGWDDLGWGFNTPSVNLLNAYEPGDVRKAGTIIFIDNSGTRAGTILWDEFRVPSSDSVQNLYYNYKAYTSRSREQFANSADKNRPKNIRILRYADVLLMHAEAAVRLGQGDPDGKINLIRERAHLSPKTGVTIADIWQERRVELAMEHDRFWDVVRQGNAAAVMHAAGKTNFMAGKHELLPIPISQILLSGNRLTQNPNY
ncbi:MAG TPA: RagB/SusD family nutrient uptake outer membrane protein [Cyclobacteriaceae bacterium]|nr:RagB/SusD family nutrient uptake outer membrane protein [Cyclobacteriaceae bacterium]HRJ81180.1 RagB/SusD family nutrient uptake outer membrane protein [Cyclobacteriaceae bacterium]